VRSYKQQHEVSCEGCGELGAKTQQSQLGKERQGNSPDVEGLDDSGPRKSVSEPDSCIEEVTHLKQPKEMAVGC